MHTYVLCKQFYKPIPPFISATSYAYPYLLSNVQEKQWKLSEIYTHIHDNADFSMFNIATCVLLLHKGQVVVIQFHMARCYVIYTFCSSASGVYAYGKQKGKTILFYVKYTMQGIWSFFCWYVSIDFMMYVYVI